MASEYADNENNAACMEADKDSNSENKQVFDNEGDFDTDIKSNDSKHKHDEGAYDKSEISTEIRDYREGKKSTKEVDDARQEIENTRSLDGLDKLRILESSNEDDVDILQKDKEIQEGLSKVSDKPSELSEKSNEKSVQELGGNLHGSTDNDKEIIAQKVKSEEGILHKMAAAEENTLKQTRECKDFPISPKINTSIEHREDSSEKQLEESRINECQGEHKPTNMKKLSPENVAPLQVSKNMGKDTLDKVSSVKLEEEIKQQNRSSTDVQKDNESICAQEPGNDGDYKKGKSTNDLRQQELDQLPVIFNEILRMIRAEMGGEEDLTNVERRSDAKFTLVQQPESVKDRMDIVFKDKNEQIKEIEKERDEYKRCVENVKSFVQRRMKNLDHVQKSKPKIMVEESIQKITHEIETLLEEERNEMIQKQIDSEEKHKCEIQICKTEMSKMIEENKTLKSSVKDKQTKVDNEHRKIRNLEKELNSERKKNHDQLSVNNDLLKKQLDLQKYNQSIVDDLKNARTALNNASDRLRERELNISEQEKSMKDFIEQNELLYQEKENMSSRIFSLQQREVDLEKIVQNLEDEKSKLNLRLSKLAGAHLTRDNPNIADLSDEYRPTKIAEKYSELYDNEWTDAFEELGTSWGLSDKACVDEMIFLLMTAYKECVCLLKPHRGVLRNIQTINVSLNNFSTRNKITQTERKSKPSSDDWSILTNFETDIIGEHVSTKSMHTGKEQINSNALSLSNKVSGIDSIETSEERETTNQEFKPEGIAVAVYDKTTGKRKQCDAFKTDEVVNRSLNMEQFNNITNDKYQSDFSEAKVEKENNTDDHNIKDNVKAMCNEMETSAVPYDKVQRIECTADNERMKVISIKTGIADQKEQKRGNVESENSLDENNEIRSSEENVDSVINELSNQDDNDSETVQTRECTGDDYGSQMLLNDSLGDNGIIPIKSKAEPGSFNKESSIFSLKDSFTTNMTENGDLFFVKSKEIESLQVKERDTEYAFNDRCASTENTLSKDSGGCNTRENSTHQLESDKLFENKSAIKDQKAMEALKKRENDSLAPVSEEIGNMNAQHQENFNVLNTPCDEIKEQLHRLEFSKQKINIDTINGPAGQGRLTDMNSLKITGNEKNVLATKENNILSKDEFITNLQLERTGLEQSTESTDEQKEVGSKIILKKVNGQLKETVKPSGQLQKKTESGHDTKNEDEFETDLIEYEKLSKFKMLRETDVVSGRVNRKHQEIQEDDSMKNFRIPDRFDLNVDTGHVCAEISVKVEFTAEQKKIISEMKKICAVKMEQEKKISEVIAQKVAFEVKNEYLSSETVMVYIKKCAELCWYMSIQEPPVVIGFENMTGEVPFDKNKYKAYTKTGKTLDFVVWPPLYLHEDGPMLCKGTAQARS